MERWTENTGGVAEIRESGCFGRLRGGWREGRGETDRWFSNDRDVMDER